MEDIVDEITYRSSIVIWYVVGANPPTQVLEGYLRKVWKQYGIDKEGNAFGETYIYGF